MAISGLIGAGAAEGLDDIIIQQLAKKKFEEQIRAQQAQEAQQQQRLSQDASQHADLMGVRTRGLDIEDAARRDRSNRQGVEDMERQAQMMAAGENQRAVSELIGQLPQGPRQVVAGLKARGVNVDDVPDPAEAAEAEARALRLHEGKAKIDARFRDRGGSGGGDQVWVTRNGQLTPIPKGSAQPGDVPHDPVAARSSQPNNRAEAADTAAEVKRIAGELSRHKGFSGAFGLADAYLPTVRQSTADAEVLRDTLQSLLTLENMGKMKGVLSDSDMKLLQRASTTINARMSEPAARQELGRLQQIMDKVIAAGGTTPAPSPVEGAPALRFVPGRGLVPVGQ